MILTVLPGLSMWDLSRREMMASSPLMPGWYANWSGTIKRTHQRAKTDEDQLLQGMLKMYSTILHSWSVQDLRSLELISSGPVAFFTFIFLNWLLTWIVERDILEQGGWDDWAGGRAGVWSNLLNNRFRSYSRLIPSSLEVWVPLPWDCFKAFPDSTDISLLQLIIHLPQLPLHSLQHLFVAWPALFFSLRRAFMSGFIQGLLFEKTLYSPGGYSVISSEVYIVRYAACLKY